MRKTSNSIKKLIQAIQENNINELDQLISEDSLLETSYSLPEESNEQVIEGYAHPTSNKYYGLPTKGLSLLHIAAFYNSLEVFLYLYKKRGIPLNIKSSNDFLPLHYACRAGSYEVALYILSSDPKESTFIIQGNDQQLIDYAILGNDPEIVEALFSSGLTVPSSNRTNLIQKAISLHNDKIIEIIQENTQQLTTRVTQYTESREATASIQSVLDDNPSSIEKVYRGQSDILTVFFNGHERITLIGAICRMDHAKKFKNFLLNRILVDARDLQIEPPTSGANQLYQKGVCHWACMYADLDVTKMLFSTKNTLVNRLDENFHTGPALMASNKNSEEVVKVLEYLVDEQQFNVNEAKVASGKKDAETLLETFVSATKPNVEAVRFLIKRGADINAMHSKRRMTLVDFVKKEKRRNKELNAVFDEAINKETTKNEK